MADLRKDTCREALEQLVNTYGHRMIADTMMHIADEHYQQVVTKSLPANNPDRLARIRAIWSHAATALMYP